MVFIGLTVDRFIEARVFLIYGSVAAIFVSPFLFYAISLSRSVWLDWGLQVEPPSSLSRSYARARATKIQLVMALILVNLSGAAAYWYMTTLVTDPRSRVTVYGIGYNLGASIFSGTASLIGASLVDVWGSQMGMFLTGLWMSFLGICTLITVIYVEWYDDDDTGPFPQAIEVEEQLPLIGDVKV